MKRFCEMTATVFKALTLAMGVAVAALSCLGGMESQSAVSLLGIGAAGVCGGLRSQRPVPHAHHLLRNADGSLRCFPAFRVGRYAVACARTDSR